MPHYMLNDQILEISDVKICYECKHWFYVGGSLCGRNNTINKIANLITGEMEPLGYEVFPPCRGERYSLGPDHCAPIGKYFEPVHTQYKDVEGLIEGGYFGKENKDTYKRVFGPRRAKLVRTILEENKGKVLPVY